MFRNIVCTGISRKTALGLVPLYFYIKHWKRKLATMGMEAMARRYLSSCHDDLWLCQPEFEAIYCPSWHCQ